jgi:hypothetical protein
MLANATPSPMESTFKVFDQIVRKRGRECTRCGGRHRDPHYKYCGPCRDLTAAWHQAYRLDHIARKICTECLVKRDKQSMRRCDRHLKMDVQYHMKQYADQRAKGLCAWGRCQNASESALCEEHLEKQRAYYARSQARRGYRFQSVEKITKITPAKRPAAIAKAV